MTAEDVIKKVASITEETVDAAFTAKALTNIDLVQKEIATVKPIMNRIIVQPVNDVITLPSDIYEIVKLVNEDGYSVDYEKISDTQIEVFTADSLKLYYNIRPSDITAKGQNLQINNDCLDALVYGTAAWMMIDDPMYDILYAKYNNMLLNITQKFTASFTGEALF